MTNSEDRPPPPLGLYWINEEDYASLLTIFEDGNTLPRTWGKAYGHPVMRVRIDPRVFPIWCCAHDTSTGREGRKRFVADALTERYG